MKIAAWLGFALLIYMATIQSANVTGLRQREVVLSAAPWNGSAVHIWYTLEDGPDASHTTVPDGTRCERLDGNWYKLDTGGPPYFLRVQCGRTIGYVDTDRVR